MKESTVNVALAAVVVVVAVVVALVLLTKTWQSGAGLDAGWGAFLVFVFGFVLRRVFPSSSAAGSSPPESGPGEGVQSEAP